MGNTSRSMDTVPVSQAGATPVGLRKAPCVPLCWLFLRWPSEESPFTRGTKGRRRSGRFSVVCLSPHSVLSRHVTLGWPPSLGAHDQFSLAHGGCLLPGVKGAVGEPQPGHPAPQAWKHRPQRHAVCTASLGPVPHVVSVKIQLQGGGGPHQWPSPGLWAPCPASVLAPQQHPRPGSVLRLSKYCQRCGAQRTGLLSSPLPTSH